MTRKNHILLGLTCLNAAIGCERAAIAAELGGIPEASESLGVSRSVVRSSIQRASNAAFKHSRPQLEQMLGHSLNMPLEASEFVELIASENFGKFTWV